MSVTRQTKRQQEKVRTLSLDIMHRAMEISQTTQHNEFLERANKAA
ncbi:hypothetical protein [Vibrio pectenicida]|nr:hypothetical protein [Vibrio pectenicida]